ncbi:YraN family protein [Rhizosaccharibacter radicis]|uniref:YraN family protein n=1 Tax=Rhizosaccharibacter radicis TaxID=2782605 RepID=A0ABT1VZL5_9PROT|nr:YraN family protein [Acetobacteraceae bacterium KSS12]
MSAEAVAAAALEENGWTILGRRIRTGAGEIDLVAERHAPGAPAILAFIEVKKRNSLATAAHALRPRQRMRLLGAADALLAQNRDWTHQHVRFDVILVDSAGRTRRIADAFREGDG